ncbi:uncharacterized protein SCHCODRAFT_02502742 [Schizophyllum commune H4-8]|nr:uncharacterized protein SCHCODRAFT_02502742 [Schizophyllum commune H4-8]KAI5891977.1 hypothetical protein SCHCODRAFT_02502742 [Schizophyllum commune H4-8]
MIHASVAALRKAPGKVQVLIKEWESKCTLNKASSSRLEKEVDTLKYEEGALPLGIAYIVNYDVQVVDNEPLPLWPQPAPKSSILQSLRRSFRVFQPRPVRAIEQEAARVLEEVVARSLARREAQSAQASQANEVPQVAEASLTVAPQNDTVSTPLDNGALAPSDNAASAVAVAPQAVATQDVAVAPTTAAPQVVAVAPGVTAPPVVNVPPVVQVSQPVSAPQSQTAMAPQMEVPNLDLAKKRRTIVVKDIVVTELGELADKQTRKVQRLVDNEDGALFKTIFKTISLALRQPSARSQY